jgi:hypothetical protein
MPLCRPNAQGGASNSDDVWDSPPSFGTRLGVLGVSCVEGGPCQAEVVAMSGVCVFWEPDRLHHNIVRFWGIARARPTDAVA